MKLKTEKSPTEKSPKQSSGGLKALLAASAISFTAGMSVTNALNEGRKTEGDTTIIISTENNYCPDVDSAQCGLCIEYFRELIQSVLKNNCPDSDLPPVKQNTQKGKNDYLEPI